MTPTRQPTRYDEMLALLREQAKELPPADQDTINALADCWGTYDKIQILNGPAVADSDGPSVQASKVIAWKCEGGPRPTWLRSITDAELVCE